MDLQDFIKNFANQFDETDSSEFTPDTNFRDLDEWSSLIVLAVLNMINKKYGVKLMPTDIKSAGTIKDLYNLVATKQ